MFKVMILTYCQLKCILNILNGLFIQWLNKLVLKQSIRIIQLQNFLKIGLDKEMDFCTFYNVTDKTLNRMFISWHVSRRFCIENLMSLVIKDRPHFDISHIFFNMDNLNPFISDMINIGILIAKCHSLTFANCKLQLQMEKQ